VKEKRKRRRNAEGTQPSVPSRPVSPLAELPAAAVDLATAPSTSFQPSPSSELALEPLSDMLFGGKLESFIVCERCKHVSHTFEDFNDLSLSIKPEDYARERKRDRIKSLAAKLKFRSGAPPGLGAVDMVRSSSVPPSPMRRSSEVPGDATDSDEPELVANSSVPRRRSIDMTPIAPPEGGGIIGEGSQIAAPLPRRPDNSSALRLDEVGVQGPQIEVTGDGIPTPNPSVQQQQKDNVALVVDAMDASPQAEDKKLREHVEFSEAEKPEKKEREKKEEDSWTKIGRRLSMLGRSGKDKDRKSRSQERARPVSLGLLPEKRPASALSDGGSDASGGMPPRRALSPGPDLEKQTQRQSGDLLSPRPSSTEPPRTASPALSIGSAGSASATPTAPNQRPDIRRLSSSLASVLLSDKDKGSRPIKPYKPSKDESEYMRRILADVAGPSANPFAIFRAPQHGASAPGAHPSTGSTAAGPQNLWSKLAQLTTIEECLRLFTSVEVLDGENMVGCHRCWKIEQGLYHPRKEMSDASSSDSEHENDDENNEVAVNQTSDSEYVKVRHPSDPGSGSTPVAASSSPVPSSSTTLIDSTSTGSSSGTDEVAIIPGSQARPRSLPIPVPAKQANIEEVGTYGGQPIPSISTTAPDSPAPTPFETSPSTAKPGSAHSTSQSLVSSVPVSSSRDSLRAPKNRRHRQGINNAGQDVSEDSEPASADSSDTEETNSTYTYSDVSPLASPMASPNASQERLSQDRTNGAATATELEHTPRAKPKRETKHKVPRSKQVILRRSFKRYLISTPPPVLVIHLKRFQQTSKVPALSFSSGFKKLDDYVAFPEYLDLTPFLAPKREDFGLRSKHARKAIGHGKEKSEECMYRLYAVVQHLGNMVRLHPPVYCNRSCTSQLGGHYVAYVALPPSRKGGPISSEDAHPKPDRGSGDSTKSRQADVSNSAPESREWAYVSDTVVRLTSLEEVLKAKAYICMYERI
jgi:hypothetical protein